MGLPTTVWDGVANRLAREVDGGLGHLLTEDVVRFATIQELVATGIDHQTIRSEVRVTGVGLVDLVVGKASFDHAFEFKFPRAPREGNQPVTQAYGALLADLYRLGRVGARERWAVQFFEERMIGYLRRASPPSLLVDVGEVVELQTAMVDGLAPTARRALAPADVGRVVRVEGVFSRRVHTLTMQVLRVS